MPNVLGGGDVAGPASATDNAVARFDGTTGKLIQNSVVTIADTTGAIAGAQSLTSPASTNLTLAGGAGNSSVILTPAGTGNVGIGLTVPTSLLTLATNSVLAWAYDPANTVSTHTITGGGTNPLAFKVYGFSADTPIFTFTGNTGAAKVTILNGGNVGIGTTSPTVRLNVSDADNGSNGTIRLGGSSLYGTIKNEASSTGKLVLDSVGSGAAGGISLRVGGVVGLGIDNVGTVSIASTTAGSSNAGALVVTGGISAGNTGVASYFGGNVSISGPAKATLLIDSTDGATNGSALAFASSGSYKWIAKAASFTDGSLFTIGTATGVFTSTPVLSLNYSTAAATFAGAVEITGATTLNNDVYQTALKKFYVDSGSNTYFHENSADSFQIVTGGTIAFTLTAGSGLFNGTVIAPAATATKAPLRIPHGTAPTSPTDGDMWTTTAGLFIRINGVTKTVTLT